MVVVLSSIATACKQIASYVARAGISNMTGLAGAANIQGEDQKKLDVIANDVFCNALKDSGRTAVIASEEEDVPVAVEETFSGNYVVVFDPLDGSSNIDAAVSTGSIFGIYEPTTTCITSSTGGSAGQVQARLQPTPPGHGSAASRYCIRAPRAPSSTRARHHTIAGELHCQRLPAGQQLARRGLLHVQLVRDLGDYHREGGASPAWRLVLSYIPNNYIVFKTLSPVVVRADSGVFCGVFIFFSFFFYDDMLTKHIEYRSYRAISNTIFTL